MNAITNLWKRNSFGILPCLLGAGALWVVIHLLTLAAPFIASAAVSAALATWAGIQFVVMPVANGIEAVATFQAPGGIATTGAVLGWCACRLFKSAATEGMSKTRRRLHATEMVAWGNLIALIGIGVLVVISAGAQPFWVVAGITYLSVVGIIGLLFFVSW